MHSMRRHSLGNQGRLAACLMALTALLGCVSHETSHFIGRNPLQVYDSTFMVDQHTMQFDESKPSVDWGMSLVWQGDHYLVSADQNTTPNQPTQSWQIVAVQDIPLLRQGQMIALGTCRDDGKPNSRVVAVVDYDPDKQWFDRFDSAWEYDYQQDAFVPHPTEHLQCLNARYGLGLDKPATASRLSAPAASTHT